jgi:hypothetical protein
MQAQMGHISEIEKMIPEMIEHKMKYVIIRLNEVFFKTDIIFHNGEGKYIAFWCEIPTYKVKDETD